MYCHGWQLSGGLTLWTHLTESSRGGHEHQIVDQKSRKDPQAIFAAYNTTLYRLHLLPPRLYFISPMVPITLYTAGTPNGQRAALILGELSAEC